jgi:hypothetical protein
MAHHLQRQRLREALNADVGGAGGGRNRATVFPEHRGRVDDPPLPLADHHGYDPLGQQKGAGQLDREHLVPDGLLQFGDGHAIAAAEIGSVVD